MSVWLKQHRETIDRTRSAEQSAREQRLERHQVPSLQKHRKKTQRRSRTATTDSSRRRGKALCELTTQQDRLQKDQERMHKKQQMSVKFRANLCFHQEGFSAATRPLSTVGSLSMRRPASALPRPLSALQLPQSMRRPASALPRPVPVPRPASSALPRPASALSESRAVEEDHISKSCWISTASSHFTNQASQLPASTPPRVKRCPGKTIAYPRKGAYGGITQPSEFCLGLDLSLGHRCHSLALTVFGVSHYRYLRHA